VPEPHDSTADRVVGVRAGELPTLRFNAGAADPHLVLDRRVPLQVGAISGILSLVVIELAELFFTIRQRTKRISKAKQNCVRYQSAQDTKKRANARWQS
jgi:hypothetical protein